MPGCNVTSEFFVVDLNRDGFKQNFGSISSASASVRDLGTGVEDEEVLGRDAGVGWEGEGRGEGEGGGDVGGESDDEGRPRRKRRGRGVAWRRALKAAKSIAPPKVFEEFGNGVEGGIGEGVEDTSSAMDV